ncbi:MAG TPA: hypothetical protein VFQ45_00895, partial [Longimicrobium sp.]|nr:hypothetical protein [Longimicrobium sp.]
GLPLLLAACVHPAPQSSPAASNRTAVSPAEPPPVYALLGARDELGLTSRQVLALDAIAERLERDNEPLYRKLSQPPVPAPVVAELTTALAKPVRAARVRRQLAQNNRRAYDEVRAVLTPEQHARVCGLGASRAPAIARAFAGGRQRARSPWPWCAEPAPARSTL